MITTIDLGGAEKQLLTLAAKQVEFGHTVFVVPLKGKLELLEEFVAVGVVVDTSLLSRAPLIQALVLRRKLNTQGMDILHAHLPRAELVCRIASNPKIKFGITRHNAEYFLPNGPRSISNFLSRWVLAKTTFQIAISKAVSEFIRANGESHPETIFDLVYYGANRRSKHKYVSQNSTNLSLVCIARLVKQKNHELLLEAIATLPNIQNLDLTIIGRGPEQDKLLKLSRVLGISQLLEWKEVVKDITRELTDYDALILPSRYEGFGLVLLEAMEIGLPIVASNCGAIVEVLGSDYPGLFENNNIQALKSVLIDLSDPKFRVRASDYLYKRFLSFGVEKLYKDTHAIYTKV